MNFVARLKTIIRHYTTWFVLAVMSLVEYWRIGMDQEQRDAILAIVPDSMRPWVPTVATVIYFGLKYIRQTPPVETPKKPDIDLSDGEDMGERFSATYKTVKEKAKETLS